MVQVSILKPLGRLDTFILSQIFMFMEIGRATDMYFEEN